jgi:hypothetical protein
VSQETSGGSLPLGHEGIGSCKRWGGGSRGRIPGDFILKALKHKEFYGVLGA